MNNNIFQMLSQFMQYKNNPQQLIQNLLQQNPQMQTIFNHMKQTGMSPEQFARQYSKQYNIDLNPIVNFMTQNGIKL